MLISDLRGLSVHYRPGSFSTVPGPKLHVFRIRVVQSIVDVRAKYLIGAATRAAGYQPNWTSQGVRTVLVQMTSRIDDEISFFIYLKDWTARLDNDKTNLLYHIVQYPGTVAIVVGTCPCPCVRCSV